MEMPIGERFVRAIAAKDGPGLLALLAPQVDFRALTPGRFWEANSAVEVVNEGIFGHWFETTDRIVAIEHIEHDVVVDRERVGYRFRVINTDCAYAVDQQAYFGVENDVIAWLRIMCAGKQPVQ